MKKIIINIAEGYADATELGDWLAELGFSVKYQTIGNVFADGIIGVDHDAANIIYDRFYNRDAYTEDEQRAYIDSLLN